LIKGEALDQGRTPCMVVLRTRLSCAKHLNDHRPPWGTIKGFAYGQQSLLKSQILKAYCSLKSTILSLLACLCKAQDCHVRSFWVTMIKRFDVKIKDFKVFDFKVQQKFLYIYSNSK